VILCENNSVNTVVIKVSRNTVSVRNINMEAKRKKWTAREEITDALLKSREKRKWQLAFRRYIIEKHSSKQYAPFFGLDIENYRNWIELQFTDQLSWDNFGSAWQFEHIVPMVYFDFSNNDDLALCWNFINLRVEKLDAQEDVRHNKIDILAAKPYFESLFHKTGYELCSKMSRKIEAITASNMIEVPALEAFIIKRKDQLTKMATLSPDEFYNLNQGTNLDDILLEREILRKFG